METRCSKGIRRCLANFKTFSQNQILEKRSLQPNDWHPLAMMSLPGRKRSPKLKVSGLWENSIRAPQVKNSFFDKRYFNPFSQGFRFSDENGNWLSQNLMLKRDNDVPMMGKRVVDRVDDLDGDIDINSNVQDNFEFKENVAK